MKPQPESANNTPEAPAAHAGAEVEPEVEAFPEELDEEELLIALAATIVSRGRVDRCGVSDDHLEQAQRDFLLYLRSGGFERLTREVDDDLDASVLDPQVRSWRSLPHAAESDLYEHANGGL